MNYHSGSYLFKADLVSKVDMLGHGQLDHACSREGHACFEHIDVSIV